MFCLIYVDYVDYIDYVNHMDYVSAYVVHMWCLCSAYGWEIGNTQDSGHCID